MIGWVRCRCGRWVMRKNAVRDHGVWVGPECQTKSAIAAADSYRDRS